MHNERKSNFTSADQNQFQIGGDSFQVVEAHSTELRGVVPLRIDAIERNRLVAKDAGTALGPCRLSPMRFEIRLGARDKEGPCQMQSMLASEIDISEIHGVFIVQLALGDMDETRNAAAQVEQRVHLDR